MAGWISKLVNQDLGALSPIECSNTSLSLLPNRRTPLVPFPRAGPSRRFMEHLDEFPAHDLGRYAHGRVAESARAGARLTRKGRASSASGRESPGAIYWSKTILEALVDRSGRGGRPALGGAGNHEDSRMGGDVHAEGMQIAMESQGRFAAVPGPGPPGVIRRGSAGGIRTRSRGARTPCCAGKMTPRGAALDSAAASVAGLARLASAWTGARRGCPSAPVGTTTCGGAGGRGLPETGDVEPSAVRRRADGHWR
jgi:hypothetical protein